ncbi:hypothetical protein BCT56_22235 [Vibrio lentus]|uniref:Transposase n=2 Tax=Vibrio lentus TaxID=136468 RepID=A0AB36XKX9_9VIBR|nr:hypothetical protein BCU51_26205 [Vibrio lentus]PMK30337.1 hypothetical protein BCU02_04340 [Vibrio lentus]PMK46053.1 hypothetical protein BCT99_21295 [Vibrio lentus]PMM43692.1 hypothetical protein BCT56_22235 [Vibrio lentus]
MHVTFNVVGYTWFSKPICEHYSDFSLAFALEKMTGLQNLSVSKETLRQWMITDGLWLPHSKRKLVSINIVAVASPSSTFATSLN